MLFLEESFRDKSLFRSWHTRWKLQWRVHCWQTLFARQCMIWCNWRLKSRGKSRVWVWIDQRIIMNAWNINHFHMVNTSHMWASVLRLLALGPLPMLLQSIFLRRLLLLQSLYLVFSPKAFSLRPIMCGLWNTRLPNPWEKASQKVSYISRGNQSKGLPS